MKKKERGGALTSVTHEGFKLVRVDGWTPHALLPLLSMGNDAQCHLWVLHVRGNNIIKTDKIR